MRVNPKDYLWKLIGTDICRLWVIYFIAIHAAHNNYA